MLLLFDPQHPDPDETDKSYCGLNCVFRSHTLKSQSPETQVTLFINGVLTEVMSEEEVILEESRICERANVRCLSPPPPAKLDFVSAALAQ